MRTALRPLSFVVLLAASGGAGCTALNPIYCDPGSGAACDVPADLSATDPGADLGDGTPDQGGNPGDLAGDKPDLREDTVSIDPSRPGPLKTASFDLQIPVKDGQIQATVYGPSDDGKTLTRAGAPFPLVVLSPGFTLDRKLFSSYAERLASFGFVAVLSKSSNEWNHARYRDDVIGELDWLTNPTGRDADRVKDRIQKDKIGLGGHSLGGKISFLVAAQDARVKALIGIDPVDANTPAALPEVGKIRLPSGVPIALLGELTNKTVASFGQYCAPANQNFEAFYDKAGAPAIAVTLVNASHNDFVDQDMRCGACGVCPPAPMNPAPKDRTNKLAVKYVAAYFLWALRGETRAKPYLSGVEIQKDVAAGYVTRVEK